MSKWLPPPKSKRRRIKTVVDATSHSKLKAKTSIEGAFTIEERVALGELIELSLMCASSSNETTQALGMLAIQRAVQIIEGESEPFVYDNEKIVTFVETWRSADPATFIPRNVKKTLRDNPGAKLKTFADGTMVVGPLSPSSSNRKRKSKGDRSRGRLISRSRKAKRR